LTIGFNLDYVLNVLGACPTETITWELTSGSASAKLMPGTSIADETQDDPEWVVMPMLL
jgi:DNA polymerase III sliding clamp (beta) subunit (PCNA family)